MGTTKKYWKGLEDLNNDPAFIKSEQSEFAEEIPMDKFLAKIFTFVNGSLWLIINSFRWKRI